MAKIKDQKIVCMHCGYVMKAKKDETVPALHDRFFKEHILDFHLTRMVDGPELPKQKTVN
jgi:hypothetical protein